MDSWTKIMETVTPYLVPALQAILILIVGYFICKIVAWAVKKLLDRTTIDDRLAEMVFKEKAQYISIESAISKTVFWLMMLFVIMAACQTLALDVVTEPLNALLTKITTYLPNFIGAAGIGFIAFMVAFALRRALFNILNSFDVDAKMNQQLGEESESKISLAKSLSEALFYGVLLLFLPQILDTLQLKGLEPVREMVGRVIGFIPNILSAALMMVIIYFVARIIQRLLSNLLSSVGFDKVLPLLGFKEDAVSSKNTPSTVVGYVVFGVLIFLGLAQVFDTLELETISDQVNELFDGIFQILVGIVIFGVGVILANLVARAVKNSGVNQADIISNIARVAILIFVGAMALRTTNLAPEIVNLAFGAVIVGLALALSLAFGLGGRDHAAKLLDKLDK
ncbi:MAG: mechanosensitive ion channel [Verrucomicrobiota bacterium]